MNPSNPIERASLAPGEGRTYVVLTDRITAKTTGDATAGAWSLFEVASPPESGAPLHRHAWDESYYVLEGDLEFQVGDRAVKAPTGTFLRMRGGTPHAYRNASGKPARFLLLASPAGVERFFEELERASREEGFGLERILAVAGKHGVEALPAAQARAVS